jgi:hypothetical protein
MWIAFGLALLGPTLLYVPSTSARPLDRNTEIRLKRAIQRRSKMSINEKLRNTRDPSLRNQVKRARSNVGLQLSYIDGHLRMIRDKRHPKVVAFIKSLKKFRTYYEDLNKTLRAFKKLKAQGRKLRYQFYKRFYKHKQTILNHLPVLEGRPARDYPHLERLKRVKKILQEMGPACKGKFRNITDDPLHRDRNYTQWCKLAAQGDAVLRKVVILAIRQKLDSIRDSFKKQARNLVASNGTLKDWDYEYSSDPRGYKKRLLAKFAPQLKYVGASSAFASTAFKEVDKALAELVAKLKVQYRKWKFRPAGRRRNDRFIKKIYRRTFRGVRINRIYVTTRGWKVYKNSVGVPTHRTRKGKILYKLKGEPWCRSQKWYYVQDYKGRRRWGKRYVEHTPDKGYSRIVSCR